MKTKFTDNHGVTHDVDVMCRFTHQGDTWETIYVPFMRGMYGNPSDEFITRRVDRRKAYILLVDGELDQVCETRQDAEAEAKELRKFGRVKIVVCPWAEQDATIDRLCR